MTFFNLNAYIILGNSLLYDYQRVYQTTRSYLGGSISELTAEGIEIIRPKLENKVYQSPNLIKKSIEKIDYEQLTIF
jgi:hypothetical protein